MSFGQTPPSTFSLPPTGRSEFPLLRDGDTYSVRWRGVLTVPVTGTYTLYLVSDDASYLSLTRRLRIRPSRT